VRVISASNRDLSAMVQLGKFRSDLFYRLNVFPVTMPALRERSEDVPLLTMYFMEKFARKLGRKITHVADETMSRLRAYSWPGNIRELQNLVERAVVLTKGTVLRIEKGVLLGSPRVVPALGTVAATPAPSPPTAEAQGPGASLQEVERQHIVAVLTETKWKIEGERGAARMLKLQPSTLRSRMKKLGIRRQSV